MLRICSWRSRSSGRIRSVLSCCHLKKCLCQLIVFFRIGMSIAIKFSLTFRPSGYVVVFVTIDIPGRGAGAEVVSAT